MMIQRYRQRISGPLLDRIDIHIEVPRVDYEKLSGDRLGEPSADIRARIERARETQRQRFAGAVGGRPQVPKGHAEHMQSTDGNVSLLCNAEMPALAPQAVSPSRSTFGARDERRRAYRPNGALVWGRRRCGSAARWMMPARAYCALL